MTLDLLFPSAVARVLDVFLMKDDVDLTIADLARKSMCSTRTINRALSTLKSLDIIIVNREVGRSKLWKINRRSPIAKYLILFCVELDRK